MTVTAYRTLSAPVAATVEEKRSVFECWLRPAADEDAARAVVEEARATHWDARHHCSAFVLGPDALVRRSNDDGEPSGTAGAPMLEAVLHAELSDVVAVVTRWFGGTLLGTGGLARAYGDAVRAAVTEADEHGLVRTRRLARQLRVVAGHAVAGRLEHDLRSRGVEVVEAGYGAEVTLTVRLPHEPPVDLGALLAELTGGDPTARVEAGSETATWTDQDPARPG